MKLQAIIIGLILFGFASCSDNTAPVEILVLDSFTDEPSITSLNGTWKVVSFEDLTTNTVVQKDQENSWGLETVVTFDDTKNPNELHGMNTTNNVMGAFNYISDRQFKLEQLGSTFINQPWWADEFSKAILDDIVSFKINNDSLRIYYNNETKSVTLTKQ